MSLLGRRDNKSQSLEIRDALKTLIQTNLTVFGKDQAKNFVGMEALSDPRKAGAIHSVTNEIVNLLKGEPVIAQWIEQLSKGNKAGYLTNSQAGMDLGMESIRNDWKSDTFERLALSIMGQMDPHNTVTKYNGVCPQDGPFQMAHSFGGAGSLAGLGDPKYAVGFGMESFDPVTHLDFIASSALINAQTAVPGGFSEVFFPTISLPPAQSGFDVTVQVPKILITQFRNTASGAPFQLQKINLVEAAYNPSMLTSNSINIVPIVTGASTPPQLVPQSVVPSWPVEILGQTVQSRPIVFNQEVGLIELSTFAAILNNGVMDATDALYTNVGIKDVFFELTLTTGIGTTPVVTSVILKNDVSNIVGTLLQQKTLGRQQALQTVSTIPLFINSSFVPVSGATNAQVLAVLEGMLGISAGTNFTLQGSVRLSAQADTEIGSMNVDESQPSIIGAYTGSVSGGGNTTYNIASLNTGTVSASITMIGWTPSARRTNSNLRTNGTIIDANNIVNYRLPINVFPPFTARTPINQMDQVTFETLGNVTNLWADGQCIEKLLQMESWLEIVSGTPMGVGALTNQCPIMGGEFVIPSYRSDLINLPQLVNNWQSKDTLVNIRAAIQTSLQYNSLQLYMDSGYSSALQMLLSDLDAYETIIVTDPLIAQYLMEAGDIRTFGDGRKYIITKSNNENIRGKIYYSFRLIGSSDLVHPMSFGCKLVSPNITYEVVPMNRNGANIREIQSMPRLVPYVNLPVLGVLLVSGLDQFASSATAAE